MGKRNKEKLPQRKYTTIQKAYEKMLYITHEGNANQLNNEISSHSRDWSNRTTSTGMDAGNIFYCWRKSQLVQPFWKMIKAFLKKIDIEFHMTQQYQFWKYTLKAQMHKAEMLSAFLCSRQDYLQLP